MPIEKRITGDNYPENGADIEIESQEAPEDLPDVEIQFDAETGDLLVNIARRVSNVRNYGKELKSRKIDPKTIWTTDKAKKYKYYETYEKEFLDSPQPIRTDLEFKITGQPYVDVEFDAT